MFAPLEFAIDLNAQTPSVEILALPKLIACRGPMNDPRCININSVFPGCGVVRLTFVRQLTFVSFMFVCLDCVCCCDSLPQYRLGFLYYYRCRLRILDSFGTDPEFNYAEFRDADKYKTGWGKADVHVRQMMTMFRKYDIHFHAQLPYPSCVSPITFNREVSVLPAITAVMFVGPNRVWFLPNCS